ncbi:hypothetical protein Mgra_00001922 [Meloidogyne graminicola]|uniref:BLOC-1-related complex subunit 7 n=1 Tax=Meloidogyne graminicola TaxID=189291 RepID=A0A8S9ZZJ0_9BILA|nr:hypothetical protein Mgra_00001922 [Meloidogyne graminicola]
MTSKKPTNITLEGKTRLPNRVQDIIIEMGTVIGNIQQTSGLSDVLQTSIRNFVAVDGIAQNSAQNLNKLVKQVELMETETFKIGQNLGTVKRLIKQTECIEKSCKIGESIIYFESCLLFDRFWTKVLVLPKKRKSTDCQKFYFHLTIVHIKSFK